jgi:hypothetical protein
MRHPNEVGGAYWMFGFVLTMASLPAALKISESREVRGGSVDLGWSVVNFFIPSTALFFCVFFFCIERRYWKTFLSTRKGHELTCEKFRNAKDDETKAEFALTFSNKHTKNIREEIRGWVEANWEKWLEERPVWFDEEMKGLVPVEFIPTANARRAESNRRSKHLKVESLVSQKRVIPSLEDTVNREERKGEDNLAQLKVR